LQHEDTKHELKIALNEIEINYKKVEIDINTDLSLLNISEWLNTQENLIHKKSDKNYNKISDNLSNVTSIDSTGIKTDYASGKLFEDID